MTVVGAPPPFRVAFDTARDPYTARNTLGIDLTSYQPIDADLTAIAALTGTNTIYYRSAADTWSPVTITAPLTFSGGALSLAPTWTAYTPTVTAGSGTLTSASAAGRYVTIGKVTHVRIEITITTNGTGASYIAATLPNTAITTITAVAAGRERAVTGKLLSGSIGIVSSTIMSILFYDNTYPGANGAVLSLSGTYENA